MVVINDENICLKFGTGNIAVGSVGTSMTFQNIKPPAVPGATITDELIKSLGLEFIGGKHYLHFSLSTVSMLKEALLTVEQDKRGQVAIENYIFDFNNFRAESVHVVLEHLEAIESHTLFLCAC